LSVPVTLLLPDNQLSEIVAKLYKTNNIVIPAEKSVSQS